MPQQEQHTRGRLIRFAVAALLALASSAVAGPPAPPTDVTASDIPFDGGGRIRVTWKLSASDDVEGYQVWRSEAEGETKARERSERKEALEATYDEAYDNEYKRLVDVEGIAPEDAAVQARSVARAAAAEDGSSFQPTEVGPHAQHWVLVDTFANDAEQCVVKNLNEETKYAFIVYSISKDSQGKPVRSEVSNETMMVKAPASILDGPRLPLLVVLIILCGTVLGFIMIARSGKALSIRKIAGLQAIDEAVGRATEMGRPILYINGIQDMDDLQTVAGVTVLGHVAKTAAEYDARIEVPTSRSLVMSAARETVESSYLSAGRSDAYNPDLIYYVTDEQFGFTAYVSGLIVREKPATCFYMGAFFAESLILAETGNSVGAIQIAGTAMPSQLPFFVAACDYTLIGEEFFAASAYLSGQPEQLGSLKGQGRRKIDRRDLPRDRLLLRHPCSAGSARDRGGYRFYS